MEACTGVGVFATEAAGVNCGVKGSVLGLAMVAAARLRVWLLSLRRFGASLILGCVWHWLHVSAIFTFWPKPSRAYLVGVSEPSCSLLLAAHQGNPFIATSTESFPNIRVAIHPPRFLWFLERISRRSTDAVCETLVIPEGRILQDKPPPRLADSTPTLALVSMPTHPFRGI